MKLLEVQYEQKYYRFFGGLLTAQEHWLNKMSEKGYRLIRTEKCCMNLRRVNQTR